VGEQSGWLPIESAPKDGRPIVGLCRHDADPYHDGDRLTDYGANAEGLGHVGDGPHIVEWTPPQWESTDEYGTGYWIPGCWYCRSADLPANPVAWAPLPSEDPSPPPRSGASLPDGGV
jgi:hypothetical protein